MVAPGGGACKVVAPGGGACKVVAPGGGVWRWCSCRSVHFELVRMDPMDPPENIQGQAGRCGNPIGLYLAQSC